MSDDSELEPADDADVIADLALELVEAEKERDRLKAALKWIAERGDGESGGPSSMAWQMRDRARSALMSESEKLRHCEGCVDDFYNDNNPHGVKRCWNLDGATLVMRKRVPIGQRPPWTQEPIAVLSCRREKGCVFVGPNRSS